MRDGSEQETLVFAQSPGIEALVTEAAAPLGSVTSMRWEQSAQALTRSSRWKSVVVDLSPAGIADAIAIARAARSRRPRSVILGVATVTAELLSVMHSAASAGLTDVVLVDVEDAVTLVRAHLRDASTRGAYAAAMRCICRAMPHEQYKLACVVLQEAAACTSVERLADRVGASRWTLDRRLSRVGITASEFVDCCRTILAAALLEHSEWTVHRVALEVGFSDVRAFRGSTMRLAGRLPAELKYVGATEQTGRAVASHLAACAARPRMARQRAVPWLRRTTPV